MDVLAMSNNKYIIQKNITNLYKLSKIYIIFVFPLHSKFIRKQAKIC